MNAYGICRALLASNCILIAFGCMLLIAGAIMYGVTENDKNKQRCSYMNKRECEEQCGCAWVTDTDCNITDCVTPDNSRTERSETLVEYCAPNKGSGIFEQVHTLSNTTIIADECINETVSEWMIFTAIAITVTWCLLTCLCACCCWYYRLRIYRDYMRLDEVQVHTL
jgi:hypothetical protein